MIRTRILALLGSLAVVLLASSVLAAAGPALSPRLEAALADEGFSWRTEDGRYTVWVFFADKGLEGDALQRALDQAEDELSERTAWRRGKVKARGERLVDVGDLPVHVPYVRAIQSLGAELRRESRWLNAASFEMTPQQIQATARLDHVRKVDLVAKFRRDPVPLEPDSRPQDSRSSSRWSLDYGGNLGAMEQVQVPAVHEMGITGEGVIIGMLDTGFHTTHEALSGIPVLAAYDFVNDDEDVDNEPGDPSSSRNHGTQTMSTAVGYMPGDLVAPAFGASVVLAKTEDVSQEVPIEEDQWVAGLEFVESHGADIVSSSLGYLDWYQWSDMDGNTAVTTIAADLAVGRGIVVVNSAGNERGNSWNHIIAPADGDSVIAVGAVTSSGSISGFSSPGPSYDGRIKPDVSALGSSNHVADPTDDYGYMSVSGTSFSCPLTSGVAALVLSRAPSLTPLQVREALRETASMAGNPNNDFGWGIINAFEAVHYFGPNLEHTPLTDTEATGTPYGVVAVITDRVGLIDAELVYRVDGGAWQNLTMVATANPDEFGADIPGQPAGAIIDYYLQADGASGVETKLPSFAPDQFFTFRVGPDETLPDLAHAPLGDQALIVWPPQVICTAADNLGIDRVELTYQLNGGPVMGPYDLEADAGDAYSLDFPLDASAVVVGDQVSYTLTAIDAANVPNQSVSGPHGFGIIDALGVVLILEDAEESRGDLKIGMDKKPLQPQLGGRSSAAGIAGWLNAAGYVADVMDASTATLADFQPYQLVILSAGDNANPAATEGLRQALGDWADAGGKILYEGGEMGYDALSNPGYPDFAARVLRSSGWNGDNAGDLQVVSGQENHPLMNNPHAIDPVLDIEYSSYGDQDAITPSGSAYAVMGTSVYPENAGILVFDDNMAPQSAQIVGFAFNVEAVEGDFGRQLTLNTVRYLLAGEPEPTASLTGSATLAGEGDHGGILVDAGGGHTALTDSQGHWELSPLYGGLYSLMFTKEGWGTQILQVDVADGQIVGGLDVVLMPVVESNYALTPGLEIPDNYSAGISSVIVVPAGESGVLSGVDVDVDISHSWIGDLTVRLFSPDGTQVLLHDRSGSSADDIVGNWPGSLAIDGPGSLDDYIGMNNAGPWVLSLADHASPDVGTLNAWGLNFLIPGQVSAVDSQGLPRVTRLMPNAPNPFNPQTRISFDLAIGGQVRLGIYDLRGHMVRRLVDGNLEAGSHFVRWDGLDDAGRGAGSGVYLYRLEHPSGVQERKMVLVR